MFRIKYSREIVLKILYQLDALKCDAAQSGSVIEEYFKSFRSVNPEEEKFIRRLVQTVMEQKPEIDALISKNLIGWKLERLALIDRNLLRMGMAEAVFNSEKPIIIDDLLRIAKKYSDADSYKLINAILDKVIN
ncbi:MAG: transcription antitermination factor NusB [Acidobacteria bacterium]|nr:transcription antitermination factor NusB [Acidobacteriota bacterium]MBU4307699.1 transcription antitermination factor NusB [Acidobacteriota bacterium]MBU4405130.1 transcription antitermination factor NusB [Acidobacteriota bacterium]MCG2811208.1 transcription antitermination factor NusB [Candidatus Aminicenantes bacterium]